MTDEDAAYYAESFNDLQRKVILLCGTDKSLGYKRIAEKIGVKYDEVQHVGWHLQGANLAYISTVRSWDEYAGSALFLNERGEKVKLAVEALLADKSTK